MTLITREHLLDILARAGLTPEQEQTILALRYPVELDRVTEAFARYSRDEELADQSPGREPLEAP
jgi:hypothetical protein